MKQKKQKKLTLLEPEGLKEVHFLTKGLAVPIALYVTSEWEKTQVKYLYQNINFHTTKTICEWCESHHILFNLFYPLPLKYIYKDPKRYIIYLKLKRKYKN